LSYQANQKFRGGAAGPERIDFNGGKKNRGRPIVVYAKIIAITSIILESYKLFIVSRYFAGKRSYSRVQTVLFG
jgi:hypothetical protein